MNSLLEYIKKKDFLPDIIYIAIGSAVLRDFEPKNRQQFPPWLEDIWKKNNVSITLINIDKEFENPYFLPSFLNLIKTYEEDKIIDVYEHNRLECIYLNSEINYYNIYSTTDTDIIYFDELNRLVLDNDKLLICGDYTGLSNNILESYFYKLYKESNKYFYRYTTKITYNFMLDLIGSCDVDLYENYPLIDINSRQIIKFTNINVENIESFIEVYKDILNFKEKIVHVILNYLQSISNCELYLFRNYLNKNYQENMKYYLDKSIINNINILDYSDFKNTKKIIKNKIIEYLLQLIKALKQYIDYNIFDEIINIIISLPEDAKQIYTFCDEYSKCINKLKYLKF